MLVLAIILAVLLILFIITLFNVYIYADFVEELSLVIGFMFLKIKILPQKPKEEKKPEAKSKKKKKDNKPKKEKPKEEEKGFSFLDYYKEKGLSGIIKIITRVAKLVKGALKDLFKKITVTHFLLDLKIAADTPADSAYNYGKACAVLFPALRAIFQVVKVKDYNVNVNPNFMPDPKTEIKLSLTARIRLCSLISFAVTKAVSALFIYLGAKPRKRKRRDK